MKSIVIDNRETALFPCLSKDFTYERDNLVLGDIVFKENDSLVLLVERKSVDDLVQSIKDGRYREQKQRIRESGIPSHDCVYLIEGRLPRCSLNAKYKGLSISAIWGSILNSSVRDGFHLFFTNTTIETAQWIEYLTKKFYGGESPFHIVNEATCLQHPDTEVVREKIICEVKKKKDIDTKTCFQYQLCQIPGISEKIALSLSKEVTSMIGFLDIVRSKEDALSWLSMCQVSEKRKIGKKTAHKILHYLGFLSNSV